MNCNFCGAPNAAGTAFCHGCMQPLATLSALAPVAQAAAPAAAAAPARLAFGSAPAPAPSARLVVLENLQPTGQAIGLPDLGWQGEVLVGRNDLASGVVVDIDVGKYGGYDKRVSRKQARIHYGGGRLAVEDWESRHGTYVNKVKLAPGARQELRSGDELRLAELVCRLEIAQ